MTNLKALRRRITTPIPATAKGAQGTPLHSLARQPCATSAATGAIGFTHVNGSRFVSAALRREGLAPPLQYNLNINSRRGAAPRLCLSKKSLWTFLTSCFQNCKINFCSIILQFCRCGGLWNAKGNPDGFLSHFSSLRNFWLGSFLTVCSLVFFSNYTCFRRNAQAFVMGKKGPHPVMPGGGHGFCRYYIASMYRNRAGSSSS